MKKRVKSLLVVLCMLITMIPTTFLANEIMGRLSCGDVTEEVEVEGVEITVTLWNYESEEPQSVEIETTETGEFYLEMNATNDAFVYNGQEYEGISVDYVLPEGYEDIYGNTESGYFQYADVWYENPIYHLDVVNIQNDEETPMTSETYTCTAISDAGEFVPGAEIKAFLCNSMGDEADRTVIASGSNGQLEYDIEYKNNRFWYEGEVYAYIGYHCMLPEGFQFEDGSMSVECFNEPSGIYDIVWGVNDLSYGPGTDGDDSYSYKTIVYKFLDEDNTPIENVDLKVWLSNTVGPDADLRLIYDSHNSEGEIQILSTDTEFMYDGEAYSYLIYECVFDGYRTWYEPANGYIGGINTYYNLNDLKEADFKWIWQLEKYEEESYETELTEDTISYEFITVDGTVVDGTKVTVSLCNQMESADKVVIGESVSGKGEFTVAHMGGFYYKDDLPYEYVEISYSFPNGYVLSDSEGLTGATVYYTVVDLCSGGKDITWLLEKAEEIIVQVPEDDSEDNKAMIILPEEKDEISNDMMDTVLEANKKYDVEIKSNNDVIFLFKVGEMKSIEGKTTYDFGVEIKTDYTSLKDAPFEEKDFVLRINYDYSGELPGNAEISIPVGDKWIGKMLYYYQILEDGTYKYTGQKAIVDENGVYKIHQNHCSDYIITAEKLETDVDETNSNTNENTDSTPALDKTAPDTGDNTFVSGYIMMLFAGLVMVAVRFSDKRRVH